MADDEAVDSIQTLDQPVNEGKKKSGRKAKASTTQKPWPRAGEAPTSAELQNAAEVRALENEKNEEEAKKTPWPNFNAPPSNPMLDPAAIKSRRDAIEAEKLVLAPGFRRYRAKRNCRNGKYRQGRIYALPEPQPDELFELVG